MIEKIIYFIEKMTGSNAQLVRFFIFSLSLVISGFALIALYVAGAAVFDREELAGLVLKNREIERFEARLNEEAYSETLPELIADRGAVAAAIWRVDVEGVSKTLLSYYNKRGEHTGGLIDKSAPLFATEGSRARFTYILEGRIACAPFEADNSPVERAMRAIDSISHACYISAPPRVGAMVGAVAIYYDREPAITEALKIDLQNAAQRVTK